MDRQVATEVFTACERAIAELTHVEHSLRKIEDEGERRELMKSLSFVIADVLGEIRAPVVRQFPELLPPEEPGEPDDELNGEEEALVSNLKPSDLESIDNALMAECTTTWRKGARVVMGAVMVIDHVLPDLPVAIHAQRLAALVQAGRLQSQGNLSYLRFSEVRLPETTPSTASKGTCSE